MFKIDSRWIWVFLGVFAVLIRIMLKGTPEIIERYYSRGLFIAVRNIFDYTIGLLPFALLYVLILGAFCFILFRIFKKKKKPRSLKEKLISYTFSLLAFLSGVVFLFLILWGFNYGRVPIEKQLGLNVQPLDKTQLLDEFMTTTEELKIAFQKVETLEEEAFRKYAFEENIEIKIRREVSATFKKLDYPTPGKVRARLLYPKGSLLRISTAGFYLPLTGECHIDPGLHPLQIPYVMAHELAHGFGIGDEGTCNFIAYLTCTNADDPIMNYTGTLSYWRSVASQYRAYDRDHYKKVRATLPSAILEHLKAISLQMDKYPDIFPAVRDATYNAYLKTQGIEEGLKNYSRVLLLVYAYRRNGE